MATIKRQPFQTVPMDMDEMEKKIREHRLKIAKRIGIAVGGLLLIWLLIYIIGQVRTYDRHEVISSYDREDTAATIFMLFQGNVLKYSNDGAFYTDTSNKLIWSQAYEMENPMVVTAGNYVAIGDKKGSLVYIFNREGLCGKIETTKPMMRIKISEKGTLAILMEDEGIAYLRVCDKTGKELAEGELHVENKGYPLDIALSKDGKNLAVGMLDVREGNLKTVIHFYNFGSAGQKKINNEVAVCEYADTVIPQMEYLDDDGMVAFGDKKMFFFEGGKKPEESKSVKYGSRLRTFFCDEKYIGMILDNETGTDNKNDDVYCLKIYDHRGNIVKEKTFSRTYQTAEFLQNHEICLLNNNECTIFTTRGVEKYHESWDKTIRQIIPGKTSGKYSFILDGETVQVKLK